eukprot:gene19560-25460_t
MGKGKTYNTNILLDVIENVKPVGIFMWKEVAKKYQEATNELKLRDYDDIKRHFIEKLCNRGIKLTNKTIKSEVIERAQAIQAMIFQRQYGDYDDNSQFDQDYEDGDDIEDDHTFIEEKLKNFSPVQPVKDVQDINADTDLNVSNIKKRRLITDSSNKTKRSRNQIESESIDTSITGKSAANNNQSNEDLDILMMIMMMTMHQQHMYNNQTLMLIHNNQMQSMMMMMMMWMIMQKKTSNSNQMKFKAMMANLMNSEQLNGNEFESNFSTPPQSK